MRWLKSIFGSDKSPASESPTRFTRETEDAPHQGLPFNYVSRGLAAWEAGDHRSAESLLRQGVQGYRRAEPDGVDFALGRLGAYLLDRERVDEAEVALEEAISRGTDIPAIWVDYLDIMAQRGDVDGLFETAMGWHDISHGEVRHWDELLARARRADRAGDSEFAEAVADQVSDRAREAGDLQASWQATGVLGHILERAGQIDRALDLWSVAFKEGTDDPTTANRLSMHLERARDYKGAMAIIEAALDRHLPANTEEQLRKRLERCRARDEGRKRRDVPAYSVRVGEDFFQPVFQARVSPAIRTVQFQGSLARCFGVSKGTGTIVDVSLADGSELGRRTDLPSFGTIRFSPVGYGLGTVQSGRVGSGETTLTFLAPDLAEVATMQVPDAISEVAAASRLWYVGCRDGHLYAFRHSGELLWRWATPGSRDHDGDAYTRPCPYFVASDGEMAVVSSMGDIYCINSDGTTIWHFQLPNNDVWSENTSIPLANAGFADKSQAGLSTDDADGEDALRLEFSITFQGIAPTVSHLTATREAVFIGSSDGRLLILSTTGQPRGVHELAGSWPRVVMDAECTPAAAFSGDALFRWKGDRFHHIVNVEDSSDGMGVWSDGLYMWARKRLDVLSWTGQLVWSVEFSKNISSAVVQEGRLVCAAGVLTAFSRAGVAM